MDDEERELFNSLKKEADRGDSGDICMLGFCYLDGFGVSKDERKAFELFKKAAFLGDLDAIYQLGLCYQKGIGVTKDEKKAIEFFKKAANRRSLDAMNNLGLCFRDGIGVSKDEKLAVSLFRDAYDLGHVDAMNNLGLCFRNGIGVSKNEKLAVSLFQKAADRGHSDAIYNLGFCYRKGIGVSKDEKLAVFFYQKAAGLGNSRAMYSLGLCYEYGVGVIKDLKVAVSYYQKAADLGDSCAMYSLGLCYEYGRGVPKDIKTTISYYEKAANLGDPDAIKKLKNLQIVLQNTSTSQKPTQIQNINNIKRNNSSPLSELNRMIGLDSVKQEVNGIIAALNFNRMRMENDLPGVTMSNHMVFTGNAGTGKTTVARILGKIFKEYGILSKGHFIEANREDLIGRYIGETAPKTKAKIEEALGGVLFIDEAYSLVPEDDVRDFGAEAISTLIKMMEDHRSDLIVIVAGYRKEMQRFINSNQGLKSRFSKYIDFPDYSPEEMQQIFDRHANEGRYIVSTEARRTLLDIWTFANQYRDFGNGRGVRNVYEKVIQNLATRLASTQNPSKSDLINILKADILSKEDLKKMLSGK